MATTDALGITRPGLGDNADLAAIVSTLLDQLEPLLAARFATSAARSTAFPTLSQAPNFNVVGEEPQIWSSALAGFFPLGGSHVWQAKLASNAGVASGAAAQVPVNFSGPAGRYLVIGHMAVINQDTTGATTQLGSAEVRFDGASSGTTPMTIGGTRVEQFTRAWFFDTTSTGSHGAQVVLTPQSAAITVQASSAVVALYLGTLG